MDQITTGLGLTYASGSVTGNGVGYTTSGLVNGDTISSVLLSSSGGAATASVGSSPYTITPSALSGSVRTTNSNYNITYTNASTGLTVNQKSTHDHSFK